jgi:uncharacterized SAM-binding protein YcdF (DUF218 family)
MLVIEDPPGPVDAVVVMAGDPDYERTLTASRLVKSSDARLLIVTGGEPGPGDSAESLRQVALSAGVTEERVRMETTSRSTREAMIAVRPILEKESVRSVALVTSPYHQRRAYLAARRAWPGVAIRNHPARPSAWSPRRWWTTGFSRRIVLTEYGKLLYYAVRGWI